MCVCVMLHVTFILFIYIAWMKQRLYIYIYIICDDALSEWNDGPLLPSTLIEPAITFWNQWIQWCESENASNCGNLNGERGWLYWWRASSTNMHALSLLMMAGGFLMQRSSKPAMKAQHLQRPFHERRRFNYKFWGNINRYRYRYRNSHHLLLDSIRPIYWPFNFNHRLLWFLLDHSSALCLRSVIINGDHGAMTTAWVHHWRERNGTKWVEIWRKDFEITSLAHDFFPLGLLHKNSRRRRSRRLS